MIEIDFGEQNQTCLDFEDPAPPHHSTWTSITTTSPTTVVCRVDGDRCVEVLLHERLDGDAGCIDFGGRLALAPHRHFGF
jgi:hypothetical protein